MADKTFNMNARRGTVVITTPAQNGTATELNMNGLGRWVDFTTADMQDSDSTNFVIKNEFGGTVYASGTVAESTSFSNGTQFPLYGTTTIVAVGEGTQSANRSVPYCITYSE